MKVDITGYAFDLAANQIGAAKGPDVLQKSNFLKPLHLEWMKILKPTEKNVHQLMALDAVHDLCKKLALQTMHKAREGIHFLTVGGDHSCAIGTWSGATQGIKKPLGLIWVDAHMDAHTPKTSITKNIHGMPLAALLGYGDKKLTHIESENTALLPDNLALIGIRSYEPDEAHLLEMLKVRVYDIATIQKRGLHQVMQEAINHVSENTEALGISIDIDAIDPEEAPAVNTPEKNGLHGDELIESLSLIAKHPHFIGAEIAEFNPDKDQEHKTEKLIARLIQALFQ